MSKEVEEILRVLDGDTVVSADGKRHRMPRIDTLEKNQFGGDVGTAYMENAVAGGGKLVPTGEEDYYGRQLSGMRTGSGNDYEYEAVRGGYALPYDGDEGMEAAQILGAMDAWNGDLQPVPGAAQAFEEAALNSIYAEPTARYYGRPGTLAASWARGGNNMQAGLHAFGKTLGDVAGVDLISEWGEEGIARNLREAAVNPAKIQDFDDIDSLDKLWTFTVESLGEQLPQLVGDGLMALTGAGAGAAVARRGAMKAMMRKLGPEAKENFRKALKDTDTIELYNRYSARAMKKGAAAGARASAAGGIYAQTAGETALELDAEGIDSPGTVFGVGAAKAALEYAPLDLLVSNVSKMTKLGAKDLGKVVSRVAAQAGLEGSTEGLQTALDMVAVAAHTNDFSKMDPEQIAFAAAKGALVGGGLATPGAVPPAYRAARAKFLQAGKEGTTAREGAAPEDMQEFSEGLQPEQEATPGDLSGAGVVTTREGAGSIKMQVDDLKNGKRGAVYASRADEDSWPLLQNMARQSGGQFDAVETEEGLLLLDVDMAGAYRSLAPEQQDELRAKLLGYQQAKSEIQDPENAKIVSTRGPNGEERFSEVVDADRAEQAAAAQQKRFGDEGGQTQIQNPVEAQQDRAANAGEQQDLFGTPAEELLRAQEATPDAPRRERSDKNVGQEDLFREEQTDMFGSEAEQILSAVTEPTNANPNDRARSTDDDQAGGITGEGRETPEFRGEPEVGPSGPEERFGTREGTDYANEWAEHRGQLDAAEAQARDLRRGTGKLRQERGAEWSERIAQNERPHEYSWNTQVTAGKGEQTTFDMNEEYGGGWADLGPETVERNEGDEKEFFSLQDERKLAEWAAEATKTNNHGEKQSETTRRHLQALYPTQRILKYRTAQKNKSGAPIFAFSSEEKIFDSHEHAHYEAELLEAAYPNSMFEIVRDEGHFVLRRWNVDPALRKEPNDTTRVYVEFIGKAINNGWTALRNDNAAAVAWVRSPTGMRLPLHAPTVSQMGMEESGDKSSVKNGFLAGLSVLHAKGWKTPTAMGVAYDANNPTANLSKTSKSTGEPQSKDDQILAALEEIVWEDGEITQSDDLGQGTIAEGYEQVMMRVDEVLESFDMDADARRMFLLAQGMDDLIIEQDRLTGEREEPHRPRTYDENTAHGPGLIDPLHPAEDDEVRGPDGEKIRNKTPTPKWRLDRYAKRVADRKQARWRADARRRKQAQEADPPKPRAVVGAAPAAEAPVKKKPNRSEILYRIDTSKHDILTAIAKLGGLNREQAAAEGIDPADFQLRKGILPVFTKKGRSFDDMAEALKEHGYTERDPNEVLDKVYRALQGEWIGTPDATAEREIQNYIEQQEAEEAARYDELGNADGKELFDRLGDLLWQHDKILDLFEIAKGGAPREYGPILDKLAANPHVWKANTRVTNFTHRVPVGGHRYEINSYGKNAGEVVHVIEVSHGKLKQVLVDGEHPQTAGVISEVITHELVHAATRGAIEGKNKNPEVVRRLEAIQRRIQKWLEKPRQYPSKQAHNRLKIMAEEIVEIPSYALTDLEVQSVLREIPATRNQTVWSQFVETVRHLLGISGENATLLEEILSVSEQAMEATSEMTVEEAGMRDDGGIDTTGRDITLADAISRENQRRYGNHVKNFLQRKLPKMLPFVFTADRELRAMGTVGEKLADWFSQQSSTTRSEGGGTSYTQGLANARNRWFAQWNKVATEIGDPKKLSEAMQELSRASERGDPATLSANARKINDFFHKFLRNYLRPAFGKIGELPIYFPRMYDVEQVEMRRNELRDIYVQHAGLDERTADGIIDNIIASGGSPDFNLLVDNKVISPAFAGQEQRVLQGDKLNSALHDSGFLHENNLDIIQNYIASSTKYAEFARINGGKDGTRLIELVDQLPTQGDKERARQIIEGYMGRIGLHSDPHIVRGMSWVMVFQSYVTLAFAAVASIVDLAGPILRARNFGEAKIAFGAVVDTLRNYGDKKERARLIGLLHERLTHQALKEAYGMSLGDSRTHKWLDRLFRWNQQERLTNFSRTISLTIGEEFLVSNARKAKAGDSRAKRYLKELNVTAEDVLAWDGEGRPLSPDRVSRTTNNVQEALYQFIDESVLRPNASQRPLWANHPMFMLLWHLKSFFWAYGKVILGGLGREAMSRYQETGGGVRGTAAAAEPLALAGMMLLPLAALARELREEIQYADEEEEPTNKEDSLEYVFGRLSDAGVLGPFELVAGATRFSDEVGGVAANLAGPAFQHLYSIPDGGLTWSDVKRATPLMNQIPWLNDYVKEKVTE